MMDFSRPIDNLTDLRLHYHYREGFVFTSIMAPANIYDAIVVRYPANAVCWSPKFGYSSKAFEEHLDFINYHKIEKAMIIADDLQFITKCPSLKYLCIVPADSASSNFDYSPLYEMPNIYYLDCRTHYGGSREPLSTTIDCSKIKNLRTLYVRGTGYENVSMVDTLEKLYISDCVISSIDCYPKLKMLELTSCKLNSLQGLEGLPSLQQLVIYRNRTLKDISDLRHVTKSLRNLLVENCPQIEDFSSISRLSHLESLSLIGSNDIDSIKFLADLPALKWLILTMNVVDGDMMPALSVPYVDIKGRKHYNLRNKDLPKSKDHIGYQLN